MPDSNLLFEPLSVPSYAIHEPDYADGVEKSFVLSSIVLPFFFRLSSGADVIERKRVI